MISRKRLVRALENSTELEDSGVELITGCLEKRIRRSSLPEEKQKRLIEISETIRRESEEHRKEISRAKERVLRRGKNEF